jgi:hypothetical protein
MLRGQALKQPCPRDAAELLESGCDGNGDVRLLKSLMTDLLSRMCTIPCPDRCLGRIGIDEVLLHKLRLSSIEIVTDVSGQRGLNRVRGASADPSLGCALFAERCRFRLSRRWRYSRPASGRPRCMRSKGSGSACSPNGRRRTSCWRPRSPAAGRRSDGRIDAPQRYAGQSGSERSVLVEAAPSSANATVEHPRRIQFTIRLANHVSCLLPAVIDWDRPFFRPLIRSVPVRCRLP